MYSTRFSLDTTGMLQSHHPQWGEFLKGVADKFCEAFTEGDFYNIEIDFLEKTVTAEFHGLMPELFQSITPRDVYTCPLISPLYRKFRRKYDLVHPYLEVFL